MDAEFKIHYPGNDISPITPNIKEDDQADQDVVAYVRKLSKNYDCDLSSFLDSQQENIVHDRNNGQINSFFNGDDSSIKANGKSIIIRTDSIIEKIKQESDIMTDYAQTIIAD